MKNDLVGLTREQIEGRARERNVWPAVIMAALLVIAAVLLGLGVLYVIGSERVPAGPALGLGGWLTMVGLCGLAVVYFLPTLIAGQRKHRNVVAIAALNVLLGWTLVGWALALVWALYREKE